MSNKEFIKECKKELYKGVDDIFKKGTSAEDYAEITASILDVYNLSLLEYNDLIDSKLKYIHNVIEKAKVCIYKLSDNKIECLKECISLCKEVSLLNVCIDVANERCLSSKYLISKLKDNSTGDEFFELLYRETHNKEKDKTMLTKALSTLNKSTDTSQSLECKINSIVEICDRFIKVVIPNTKNIDKNKEMKAMYNNVKLIKLKYGNGYNPSLKDSYNEKDVDSHYSYSKETIESLMEIYNISVSAGLDLFDAEKLGKMPTL